MNSARLESARARVLRDGAAASVARGTSGAFFGVASGSGHNQPQRGLVSVPVRLVPTCGAVEMTGPGAPMTGRPENSCGEHRSRRVKKWGNNQTRPERHFVARRLCEDERKQARVGCSIFPHFSARGQGRRPANLSGMSTREEGAVQKHRPEWARYRTGEKETARVGPVEAMSTKRRKVSTHALSPGGSSMPRARALSSLERSLEVQP